MAADSAGGELVQVVALLGSAVVMVPLFRRLGLGSILGYLAAGLVIGPFGLGWFSDPAAILHVAELGVVMFLFVIGLEMQPSHLWNLRREIFGLGTVQIGVCALALTGVLLAFGFSLPVAFIGAMGFVLTSTATVVQLLGERGDLSLPHGQRIISVLLFEDLLIVPLLAVVAFMSPLSGEGDPVSRWRTVGVALASLGGLVAAGLWLLNPLFRILAASRAREVMTAAALLVVLGAALLMQLGGLSMAMGAFLAGVLLSESSFRHQLEADIEPFRGILLGLFFLAVGMSLDLSVVARNLPLVLGGVAAMMLAKAVSVYAVARLLRASHAEALDRSVVMAQGGEFAFVLYSAAAAAGVIDAPFNASITAIVVLSMALTPVCVLILQRLERGAGPSMDDVDLADGLSGSVLIIGFGRFGQVVSQALLARAYDVAIIDTDTDMIRSAAEFGFKIYYGDGRRADVLRASGAGEARVIAVCVDDRAAAKTIVELARQEFPQAKLLVRAYDRRHAVELVGQGVDYQVRETFDAAIAFGEAALRALGVDADAARATAEEVRRRDAERFVIDVTEGLRVGRHMLIGNQPKPTPLTRPQRESVPLSEETAEVTAAPPAPPAR